jgi:hypothetical protein
MNRLVFIFAVSACGRGALTPTYEEPIQILNVRIASAAQTPDTNTRLSLDWYPNEQTFFLPTPVDIGQAANIGVLDALSLDSLPPARAMTTCGTGCTYAWADLVYYEDGNNNHQFDLVPYDALTAPDRVVGALKFTPRGDSLTLQYLAGKPDPSVASYVFGNPPQGFVWWVFGDFDPQTNGPPLLYTPISQAVEIDLDGSAQDQQLMCQTYPVFPNFDAPADSTLHELYPDFNLVTNIQCAPDGSWTADVVYDVKTACLPGGNYTGSFGSYAYFDFPQYVPPDWPCPVPTQ